MKSYVYELSPLQFSKSHPSDLSLPVPALSPVRSFSLGTAQLDFMASDPDVLSVSFYIEQCIMKDLHAHCVTLKLCFSVEHLIFYLANY
jgi:hypothetical protein